MNFKRKAIEPIVATILLVVVAVILVTIVLAWGRNFANEGLSSAGNVADDACSAATIAASDCDWNKTSHIATFKIRNTSNTYTIAASDIKCGIVNDSNALNSDLPGEGTNAADLAPGAFTTIGCTATNVTTADKITLSVWSKNCPNMATAEVKNCS